MTVDQVPFSKQPHRRFNPLCGEWVFVSPQRTQRPWQGQQEPIGNPGRLPYEPECYLCPGNARANGARNPAYASTFTFTNDFPAFLPEGEAFEHSNGPLLRAEGRRGTCRVICYSPRHDLTLAELPAAHIRKVIDAWANEVQELRQHWRWVQIFENKGEMMGCSNAHPHGQVWASDFIPNEPTKELIQQKNWLGAHRVPLLIEYAHAECAAQERLLIENSHWVALVPWWAIWPYETLIIPRRRLSELPQLLVEERDALAELLSRLLCAYDRLFEVSFPYSFGWHGIDVEGFQLHAHIYPPLLRSAAVRKFMVGYEMLAEPQRDMTPESAARRLRQCL
jgi:UDPglucose--hexose-1-phosphate uridylyltransferase